MRLINSDSEVVDVTEARGGSSASSSGVRIDIGAIAFVSILAVAVVAIGFAIDAKSDARHARDLLNETDASWQRAFDRNNNEMKDLKTEYRVVLNHYMELEAQLKEKRNAR